MEMLYSNKRVRYGQQENLRKKLKNYRFFFFSSRRRHTRSVSAFLLNRSSDLIAYPTTKIRVNATCRKCPHKVHRMEMKTAISCTILRHTKILIAVGV